MPLALRRIPLPSLLRRLQRFEGGVLVGLFVLVLVVWGFVAIGGEMAEGETQAFDGWLLLALREPGDLSDPIGPRTLEEALRDLTALGGFTVLTMVTAVAALAFYFHRKHRHALVMVVTVVSALIGSEQLKSLYGRPRPDLVPHGSYVYSGSFPSGHSMLAAATYLTLAMLIASLEPKRQTKALAYVLAGLVILTVGFSRVYLGVHWPSDVLAGWAAGAAWALAAWVALIALRPRAAPGA